MIALLLHSLPFHCFLVVRMMRSIFLSMRRPLYHHVFYPFKNDLQRFLHLHEYQSKELLAKYQVNTQPFKVGSTVEELVHGSKQLRSESSLSDKEFQLVVKAQVLAGGRGKGFFVKSGIKGGVQLVRSAEQVALVAQQMLQDRLVTIQTPSEGVLVNKVMVAEAVRIVKETYLAILMDRSVQGPIILASPMGGMDIETIAKNHPSQIFKEPINIEQGLRSEQAERLVRQLGFPETLVPRAAEQMQHLYGLFISTDSTQVEVNPFALTSTGKVMAIDAKVQLDDNAAFRQQAIFDQRDMTEEDPREAEAAKHKLNYIRLDGTIGCLVNGAGLAMATMDMIRLVGGHPTNFLDVGGNANADQVKEAFKILTSDQRVKAILVNIFGGMVKCDTIANGIVAAAKDMVLNLPLVIRLFGTNVDLGKKVLNESGLDMIVADDMEAAARLAYQQVVLSQNKKPTSMENN